MRRRILAVLSALIVAVGGIWIASAAAQTDVQPPLGTWCPIPTGAVAGQAVTCKVVADPDWTPPTQTTTVTPTTTVAPTTTTETTTVSPTTTTTAVTTTTQPPNPEPPALMGWQLTSTNVGLAPHGLTCAGLQPYLGPAKPAANTVISGKRIETGLDLSAGGVVVEKSCIKPKPGTQQAQGSMATTMFCHEYCETGLPTGTRATIRDSEIDGSSLTNSAVAKACAFDGIADLMRNYMHDVGSGICIRTTDRNAKAGSWSANLSTSAVVSTNYVTRLRHYGDAHHDGGTVRDFRKDSTNSRTLVFVNNRFDSQPINTTDWQTAAFFVQPTYSGYSINNVWLDGNLFEGRAYNLVLEQSSGGYSNVHSTNNRFRQPANCGGGCYGYSAVTGGPGWSEWTGNYQYSATAANNAGAVVSP